MKFFFTCFEDARHLITNGGNVNSALNYHSHLCLILWHRTYTNALRVAKIRNVRVASCEQELPLGLGETQFVQDGVTLLVRGKTIQRSVSFACMEGIQLEHDSLLQIDSFQFMDLL